MMNKKERFDIRQLIERREEKFGCVEPSITQLEEYQVNKNITKLQEKDEIDPSEINEKHETQLKLLEKLKRMRDQMGQEHLKAMHKGDRDVITKVKLDVLELYAMQMEGRATVDNKEIHYLSVSEDQSED